MRRPRSRQLDLSSYDTDKIANRYLEMYDPIFLPLVEAEMTLLELGVHRGGSLRLWRDYFPRGTIVGVDVKVSVDLTGEERIHVFQGSQADVAFLTEVAGRTAPEGFDVIIDDASHIAELTKIAFWHLFEHHLKSGALYVIEDWGTGYWDDWPDGRSSVLPVSPLRARHSLFKRGKRRVGVRLPSHDFGMVGFIKQLVDEQGAADLSRGRLRGTAARGSRFESLLVMPSIVVVRKART